MTLLTGDSFLLCAFWRCQLWRVSEQALNGLLIMVITKTKLVWIWSQLFEAEATMMHILVSIYIYTSFFSTWTHQSVVLYCTLTNLYNHHPSRLARNLLGFAMNDEFVAAALHVMLGRPQPFLFVFQTACHVDFGGQVINFIHNGILDHKTT